MATTWLEMRLWLRLAGARALRTALVTLVPLLPFLLAGDDVGATLSTIAMAGVLSLVTSLAGLPENTGRHVTWWYATAVRAVKTFGQVLAAQLAVAVILTDVDWAVALWSAFGSACGTVLLAAIARLPEVEE